jgi:hypothetical protein
MSSSSGRSGERILSRLRELEAAQGRVMSDMRSQHEEERAALLARIAEANERRRAAELGHDMGVPIQPVLMEVNMTQIDAAVQAAAHAENESREALKEAQKVADSARAASTSGAVGYAMVPGVENAGDGLGFGADHEYVIKQVSVNLDDVERVINNSPLVEVCRAFGRPDAKYGNEVYCCVVPKRNVRVSEPMLMLYAQKYLSTALCPKRFFFLESLPTGITRKALADTRMSELAGPQQPSSNGASAPSDQVS